MMSLIRTGSVEEYSKQFELCAGPLRSADPNYLKGMFRNGLKEVTSGIKIRSIGYTSGSDELCTKN